MQQMRLEDRDLLKEINADFLGACGPLLSGSNLQKALGYADRLEFEAAQRQGSLPVRTFAMEGREGVFAYSWDVACWLVRLGRSA